jgi:dynein heavy chain
LEYAKTTAKEINERIAESTVLEEEINRVRNEYRSVSIRGSVLYFVIKDLSLIDPMYQYSLQYVQMMFNKAIDMSEASKVLDERLGYLILTITKVIYNNVCRGLFEEHKLIYSFLITVQINRKAALVSDLLWSSFLRGAGVFDKSKLP